MINVAIDGPAGAGKSTVAKAVAKELGLIYLDTGAMYRAVAYTALKEGLDVKDEASVSKLLEGMSMDIVYEDGVQQIYVNGFNTTPYLREHYMSKAASDISALPVVRYKMVELQREFSKTHDVVLDGRDIGTFVLPDANCKLFMTATAEERANRRYKELVEKGQEVEYNALLEDIKQRDYNDSHRAVAPLKQADDAKLLDTTEMSLEEVIAFVKDYINSVIAGGKISEPEVKNNESDVKTADSANSASQKVIEDKTKKYYAPLKSFGFYRFIRGVFRPLQAIVWPTKIVGFEGADEIEGNAIFICNHFSKVDTFLPCVKLFKKEAHILAKHELFEKPIPAWFLYHMGAIPVRRGEADIDSVKCILRVLKSGRKLLIFPEGTRNKEGTQNMAEFKSGTARFAIKTKSPIIPMLYYAPPKAFKKNWLYIGEPFTLEEFYDMKGGEAMRLATEKIRSKMDEVRQEVNAYVEALKKK